MRFPEIPSGYSYQGTFDRRMFSRYPLSLDQILEFHEPRIVLCYFPSADERDIGVKDTIYPSRGLARTFLLDHINSGIRYNDLLEEVVQQNPIIDRIGNFSYLQFAEWYVLGLVERDLRQGISYASDFRVNAALRHYIDLIRGGSDFRDYTSGYV